MAKDDQLDVVLSRISDEELKAYQDILKIKDEQVGAHKVEFFNNEIRGTYRNPLISRYNSRYQPDYDIMVKSVARKLRIPCGQFPSLEDVENKILLHILELIKKKVIKEKGATAWQAIEEEAEKNIRDLIEQKNMPGMNPKDILNPRGPAVMTAIISGRLAGMSIYLFANQVFFSTARVFGVSLGGAVLSPAIGRVLAIGLGPVGLLLSGVLLLLDLNKFLDSDWKKLIPSVVLTILYRRMLEYNEHSAPQALQNNTPAQPLPNNVAASSVFLTTMPDKGF
jgi:hypothetical protein